MQSLVLPGAQGTALLQDDDPTSVDALPLSLVTRSAPHASIEPNRRSNAGGHEDDLIAELFDAMHELHFLSDAIEAGDFCLRICLEKLGCESAVVHIYQSDTREFVVTNARGGTANRLLLRRFAESDAALASVMSQRRPVVLEAAANGDDQSERERCVARDGWRRVLLAPVMPVGRFLGAIELFNTVHGGPFSQSDSNALAYIAQHFADFIATHGVVTSQDRIRGRSERPGANRIQRPTLARA